MIEEIRDLFQNLIAPQLESIKGDIRALDAKFDSKIEALDAKIDFKFDTLDAKIDALDVRLGARIDALDTKLESYRREFVSENRRIEQVFSTEFVRLEEKLDLRLANMDTQLALMNDKFVLMNDKLDTHRRELLAEIRAALK